MRRRTLLALVVALACLLPAKSQQQNSTYQNYIATYARMAQDQMNRYGIPASITLAQGLLESGAGQSMLATKANNHFGIKVGVGWIGPYVMRDDDRPNERFRQYNNVAESFEDHSKFLIGSPRYQSLFLLPTTDYKGWAKGLKKCGYATSPTYAENLINIIELYDLAQYDKQGGKAKSGQHSRKENSSGAVTDGRKAQAVPGANTRSISDLIHFCNGKRYVIAQQGDTWKSLSRWYGVSAKKLRKRNEYPEGEEPIVGAPIYLDKKATNAAKALKGHFHVVQPGESLHTISQQYGMKMKTLYRVNELPWSYSPKAGDRLMLR